MKILVIVVVIGHILVMWIVMFQFHLPCFEFDFSSLVLLVVKFEAQ
jgi:hypothetical protein